MQNSNSKDGTNDDSELMMGLLPSSQTIAKPIVSRSALLPDGWKVYKCTDCQEINVKKDNRQITVGYCDNCQHPLWNDDVE